MPTSLEKLLHEAGTYLGRRATFAPAILATVVALIVFVLADHQRQARLNADERAEVAEKITSLAARLQTNLIGDIMLLQGIVAGIAVNPTMDEAEYARLSAQVLQTPSQLKIITAAPNLVVRWVYPTHGNEKVIGLDYRTDKQQHDGAMAARNSHNIVLVGPIHLVQGGEGFIARTPVYITDGRAQTFWGLLSGVIDVEKLYSDSGLTTTDLDIAISSPAASANAKNVFYGDASILDRDPMFASLDMGYGRWTIAGTPKSGWGSHNNMTVFRLAAGAVCLAVVAPMLWAGSLARSRQKTIVKLRERESDLMLARQDMEYQSLHDPLTELPNRRYLDRLLASEYLRPERTLLSLIHVDLDAFKEVNDSRGHAGGDTVLRVTASRLRDVIGPDDVAMRIGGDEFVIATRGDNPKAFVSLAHSIVRELSTPILVDGVECKVGASAGVAWQRENGNVAHLLGNADLALYEAKRQGRGQAEVFTRKLGDAARATKKLGDEIEAAIERNELVPYFQPQFDVNTHSIVGVEALVRWDHPERGILAPAQFLSVAEERGWSSAIDRLVLQRSLFELTRWDAAGMYVPRISVNVSAQRLVELANRWELSSLVFQRGRLCFELLESISFEGQSAAFQASIQNVKELGIDIEIDDFGTGHASILSLLELRPRRLKIDRQIVMPITQSTSQRRLVSSIVEIGRSQNIEIVAEGVETMEHASILRDLGCHVLQGYAFARPMSSEEFMRFYEARKQAGQHVA
ncbi:bifunctional diguanylate cyclase/phosphodiesterase [Neorhizobium sp. P12A]|uniref:bifunctional diguanylate cyclase/phosphodiesterase n=1 Tax=Neorhizobium sp. P12A TaxID=2268027 RepID=UPI0011EF6FA6|nr:EAL domain-containing protein [Neorhizobium sp. P12A]KAA0694536.1 bifunctional diguanylate cyclase/phosphodiesterase [Neorhizobium sp. P12A]